MPKFDQDIKKKVESLKLASKGTCPLCNTYYNGLKNHALSCYTKNNNKDQVKGEVAAARVLNEIGNTPKNVTEFKGSNNTAASQESPTVNKSKVKKSTSDKAKVNYLCCVKSQEKENNNENENVNKLAKQLESSLIFKKSQSGNETTVVSVRKLNLVPFKFDHICSLFSLYGQVLRMKWEAKTEPDCFYIEFSKVAETENCIKYLHNLNLFGQNIEIGFSSLEIKEQNVEKNYIVKEYIDSELNRNALDLNVKCQKPSMKLSVVSGQKLPENELNFLFSENIDIQISNNEYTITFKDIESATKALMLNHGRKLTKESHVFCSFYNP